MTEIDTDWTDEVTCPYCGDETSDSWEMVEGDRTCDECGKDFFMERNETVTYTTRKKT